MNITIFSFKSLEILTALAVNAIYYIDSNISTQYLPEVNSYQEAQLPEEPFVDNHLAQICNIY